MNQNIANSSIKLLVDNASDGERLDRFLSEDARLGSRTVAQSLINSGDVLVNGAGRSKSYKLAAGDIVEFRLPDAKKLDLKPVKVDFKIVYEDKSLAVISKPAGLVVHPSHSYEQATLVHGLLAHFETLSTIDKDRPGIVHRLDKDTSGLMIIAKREDAHRVLSDALKNRKVDRQYNVLVLGDIKDNGTIDAPVGRSHTDRKKMAVVAEGKTAQTDFDVVKRFGEATLLTAKLHTGRTHQIRAHMNYIGHPVAGDSVYGGKGKISEWLGLERQFLHSGKLKFKHPLTDEELLFEDPIPDDLQKALKILEKRLVVKS